MYNASAIVHFNLRTLLSIFDIHSPSLAFTCVYRDYLDALYSTLIARMNASAKYVINLQMTKRNIFCASARERDTGYKIRFSDSALRTENCLPIGCTPFKLIECRRKIRAGYNDKKKAVYSRLVALCVCVCVCSNCGCLLFRIHRRPCVYGYVRRNASSFLGEKPVPSTT